MNDDPYDRASDLYDRMDSEVRQLLYLQEAALKQADDQQRQRRAILKEFVEAYEDGNTVKARAIYRANPDLVGEYGDHVEYTWLLAVYKAAKAQLGTGCPHCGETE